MKCCVSFLFFSFLFIVYKLTLAFWKTFAGVLPKKSTLTNQLAARYETFVKEHTFACGAQLVKRDAYQKTKAGQRRHHDIILSLLRTRIVDKHFPAVCRLKMRYSLKQYCNGLQRTETSTKFRWVPCSYWCWALFWNSRTFYYYFIYIYI